MRREYQGYCALASVVKEGLSNPPRWEDSTAFWAILSLWREHLSSCGRIPTSQGAPALRVGGGGI